MKKLSFCLILAVFTSALIADDNTTLKKFDWNLEPAGASTRIERSYENAPPLIPHDVTDLLPITTENNACLGCHDPSVAADIGATPLPKSHFTDFRTGKFLDKLSDERYNCTQCHVPQAKTEPFVPNEFKPTFRDKKNEYHSNLMDILNEGVK